ncbi:MAG: sulfur oxidation c-type cytochrome SoxX [Rhizobacter sp.]|nr:sulfur oxidation c-type cytochrome SoxX [Rhizobacter sp.]
MKTSHTLLLPAIAALLVAGCATRSAEETDREALQVIRTSFRDQGIAKVDRLDQDMANDECSKAQGKPLSDALTKAIEEANAKTIRQPADGRYLGDWKRGEAIAQDGRGMTFTDSATQKNGGNCYNCHQISKTEISYGTIGPSLYHYGKLRGVTDPTSEAAKPMVEYTWGKLWNARATNACSQMPRFGHKHLLSEDQMRDVMALLLDPKSPVNAE